MSYTDPQKNREYNATYRGEQGSPRRKRYNEESRLRNRRNKGEPGSPKRDAYNEKRRVARKAASCAEALAEIEQQRETLQQSAREMRHQEPPMYYGRLTPGGI